MPVERRLSMSKMLAPLGGSQARFGMAAARVIGPIATESKRLYQSHRDMTWNSKTKPIRGQTKKREINDTQTHAIKQTNLQTIDKQQTGARSNTKYTTTDSNTTHHDSTHQTETFKPKEHVAMSAQVIES